MEPIYFTGAAEFRAWLEEHHEAETELLVGYHKKGTGRPSMTWPESVDEALCFGWIDGVRRRVDDDRYCIRFTPRKPTSTWSAVNVRRFGELEAEGLVRPAGRAAFERRAADRTAIYSYEQAERPELAEDRFAGHPEAWAFFSRQPPGYRRTMAHWVTSAKRSATRERRLAQLIEASAEGRRVSFL